MTTLKVGIASYEEMKARTMALARGERRVAADEPKVWFTSTESFAKVLSAGNRELLRVIAEKAPGSLDELARITGKAKSNLSRTLRTMEGYGLVRLERGERGLPYQLSPARAAERWTPAFERVRELKDGWIGTVRPPPSSVRKNAKRCHSGARALPASPEPMNTGRRTYWKFRCSRVPGSARSLSSGRAQRGPVGAAPE